MTFFTKAYLHYWCGVIVLGIISTTLSAQSVDELATAVVFLRCQSQAYEMKNGEQVEVWYKNQNTNIYEPKLNTMCGTGFLVFHNNCTYLVTAKHIAKSLANNSSSEIIVKLISGKIEAIKLVDIEKGLPLSKWMLHKNVDIAVHLFRNPAGEPFKCRDISDGMFMKSDKDAKLLTTVIILGFPLGQGLTDMLSPLAKRTQIASGITSVDLPSVNPGLKFILLADALAQGYSGAPVFTCEDVPLHTEARNNAIQFNVSSPPIIQLLGIQSSALSDATGGKISVVVPISYLFELFQSAEFKAYEKEVHKNDNKRTP